MVEFSKTALSPMNYLKIIFRRKALFLLPMFAGLIIGICTGILLPKKYRSSTIILVEEGKTDNPLFSQIAVSTTMTQRLTAIRESMLGWSNLVQLVERLKLGTGIKNQQEFEFLILKIRNSLSITLRASNIIDLSYVGKDAKETQAIVQNITDIFVEKNVEAQTRETSDAIAFIEGQLKIYRGKIKSAEIAQMQDELNALLIDSTEGHPRVKQLREEISAKQEELKRENLEFSTDVTTKDATNNPIIDEIKRALDSIQGKNGEPVPQTQDSQSDLYKVMLLDKLDNVMARDVGVNTGIYNVLLQRLETAKITQRLQQSKEGTRYTILDPPREPLKPFYPNKMLVGFIGIFFGGMLGAGLVMLAEFLDKSFLDVQDAKEFFGVPLLGAISKITTVETIREAQERERWYVTLTVIIGIAIVMVTVAISNYLQ